MKIRIIVLAAVSLLFTSCIGINTVIDLNQDGSGSVAFEYKISDIVMNMGQCDGKCIPLPVSKADFENTVKKTAGLSLRSYKITESGNDSVITAKIDFDNEDALLLLLNCGLTDCVSLTRKDGVTTFRQTLSPGNIPDIDPEILLNMKSLFDGYTIRTTLNLPVRPSMVSGGEMIGRTCISDDYGTGDVLFSEKPVVWEVQW